MPLVPALSLSTATSVSNEPLTPTTWDLMTLDDEEDLLWPTEQDVAEMALMLYNPPRPLSWDRRTLKRLPLSAVPIRLIGEGAANVVFELGFPTGSPSASTFNGWLLRVAKAPMNGDIPRFNYLMQQEFYAKRVHSILKKHVIQQELVVLRGSNIVRKLNDFLSSIDHERKEKFRGSFVADTNWGFLVEDMRPTNPNETLLIEFKPKWLAQSPSAPSQAVRCRQCAMELYNFITDPGRNRTLPLLKPCALMLGTNSVPPEINDPFRIAPDLKSKPSFSNNPHIINALKMIANHPVIHDLRAAQRYADRDGPLFASRDDADFHFAMTIRDCACFALIPLDPSSEQPIKIRLGDFDFKDPSIKFDRWHTQEINLQACYTADWILCDKTYYHPPTACLLEWRPRRQPEPETIIIQDKACKADFDPEYRSSVIEPLMAASVVHFQKTDKAALKDRLQGFRKDTSKPNDLCPYRLEPV